MTLPLLRHQESGCDFLSRRSRAGLFDVMGLGKTATAIAALDAIDADRVIVVCPAAVREVWRNEFKKFSTRNRRIIKGSSVDDLNLWLRGKVHVLIISYEMATRWAPKLAGDMFDALILDEMHYCKAPGALRTRALLGTYCDGKTGLARWAAHVWFLSGTPAPNDPIDIWPFLRFCGGTPLGLTPFTARYFRSRQGQFSAHHELRPEMADELRQCVNALSLRRTKEDAGVLLPPIWLTTQTVDGDTREVMDLIRDHPGLEGAVVEAIEKGGLSFLDAQHVATLRRLVGEAKAPAFASLLVEEMENGLERAVVFGIHRKALDHVEDVLRRRGIEVCRVDGSTSENARVGAVRRFQDAKGDRIVFLGNIRAAGIGLTLTAASDVIIFESDWSPAGNAQALMRVHRIGQENAVQARFITLANSIDEVVNEAVARKTGSIAKLGWEMMA